MSVIKFPAPELQVNFAFSLKKFRSIYLQNALLETIRDLDIVTIDRELSEFVSTADLASLAQHGLRGELLFAVPSVLRARPSLLDARGFQMTMTSKEMRESAMRAPTAAQRREELEAASRVERQEKEALYGKAAPLVLELQQKLAESERATVRERHRSAKFEARVRDLQKAILDVTGRDVSRWACGFDGAIRAGISDEARRQASEA